MWAPTDQGRSAHFDLESTDIDGSAVIGTVRRAKAGTYEADMEIRQMRTEIGKGERNEINVYRVSK